MTGIKAFVGHSFTEVDEAVVSNFLEFFTRVEALLDNFEWSHAKKAAPKELADKVLETIEGCNTLIAICTCKEMVVANDALKPCLFNRALTKVSRSDFVWKTSDWVIQEIGLAIGKGMSVIVLLEEGCRKPGGLQGDVEYISFERSAPERSHGKLLEMIKSLSPSATSAPPLAREKPNEDQPTDSTSENEHEKDPDASWDFREFELQFFWALVLKKRERAERINQAFLNSVIAKDEETKATWQAVTESQKIVWSDHGQLSNVRASLEKFPQNAKILSALANVLSHLGQKDEAGKLYAEAADLEKEKLQSIEYLSSSSYQFMSAGNRKQAEITLERLKEISGAVGEIKIAQALRSFAEIRDDKHLKVEAMESIARLNPDDHDNRFTLAFVHAELGNSEIALHHYLLIPSSQRSGVAWNNLGVAFQNLSVPGRAIQSYKKAADQGETLAMSNLSYRYMNAGFFDEAKSEIRRAMQSEEPHRNVGEAYAFLADAPDAEAKLLKDIEEKAASKVSFYSELSQAVLEPNIQTIAQDWIGPKGPVKIELIGTEFVANWEYQTGGNALQGLLSSKPNRYRVEVRGELMGRRVHGKLKETRLEGTPSIFGDHDLERNVTILFSKDKRSAFIAENLEKRTPTFYNLNVRNFKLLDDQAHNSNI